MTLTTHPRFVASTAVGPCLVLTMLMPDGRGFETCAFEGICLIHTHQCTDREKSRQVHLSLVLALEMGWALPNNGVMLEAKRK